MKACASEKPNKFTFEEYPRGGYILWLRENFYEVIKELEPDSNEDETSTSWVYDEYTILMPEYLSNNFIEQHFNEYISSARKEEASDPIERLATVEDAVEDILDIIADLAG